LTKLPKAVTSWKTIS